MATRDICSNLKTLQHVALLKLVPETVLNVILHRVRVSPHLFAFVVKKKAIKGHHCFWQNYLASLAHLRLHEVREGFGLVDEVARVVDVLRCSLLGLFGFGFGFGGVDLLFFLRHLSFVKLLEHLLCGETCLLGCVVVDLLRLWLCLGLLGLPEDVGFVLDQLLVECAQWKLLLLCNLHGTGPLDFGFGIFCLLLERKTR